MKNLIKLSTPIIGKEEINGIAAVLKNGQISQGPYVEAFEREFSRFVGAKYAVAVSSGTAALHLTLLALDIKKGDEVITTPFSFIATANSITYTGARPVFVDIDETFNLKPGSVEKKITKNTKAILVVHLFGLPADIKTINKIAKKYNLKIIEDASQAHGAKIGNRYIGTFGNAACFSFYATKNITTGEGGMVVTNEKKLAEKIRNLRNHGRNKKGQYSILGYNFRMNEIQAALGSAQLKKLKTNNHQRIKNAIYLSNSLKDIKGIILPTVPGGFTHVFHQYTLVVTPLVKKTREEIVESMNKSGIEVGIFYNPPIHKQPLYKKLGYRDKLPVAERFSREVLSLPIHPLITKKDLDYIARSFRESLNE